MGQGEIEQWVRYERKQLQLGLGLDLACGALILIATLGTSLKHWLRRALTIVLVGIVCLGIGMTAKAYLVVGVPYCLFQTGRMRSIKDRI